MNLDWESFVRQVMETVDLAEFLGQYTRLKKVGNRYMGCCPLHAEKKPSFSVSADIGLWHCFGCGKGGNIFSFLKEKENMTFFEAAEMLSARYNIPLPKFEKKEEKSHTKVLFEIHEVAERFFADFIRGPQGEPFKEYLKSRMFTKDLVERFNIGASPSEWDILTNHLRKKGFTSDEILASGLALKGEQGRLYDRFRHRLIIPIRDHLNRTVGFGGRVIGDGEPKYLNSPESPIFKKSDVLFGFYLARDSIRKNDCAIVMEGYTDVMRAHQVGVDNAVASMGTALTSKHIEKISRHTQHVILAFDGDQAGINAAIRSAEELVKSELVTRVIIFDEGLDPEEFLKLKGKTEFMNKLNQARSGVRFLIDSVLPHEVPGDNKEREFLMRKVAPYIGLILDLSERNKVIVDTAARLELNLETAKSICRRIEGSTPKVNESLKKLKQPKEKPDEIETHIIRYIVNFAALRQKSKEYLDPCEFRHEPYRELMALIFSPDFPIDCEEIEKLPQIYGNDKFSNLVSELRFLDPSIDYKVEKFCFWVYKLKEREYEIIRKRNRRLIAEANERNDEETVMMLTKENADLATKKEWFRSDDFKSEFLRELD